MLDDDQALHINAIEKVSHDQQSTLSCDNQSNNMHASRVLQFTKYWYSHYFLPASQLCDQQDRGHEPCFTNKEKEGLRELSNRQVSITK